MLMVDAVLGAAGCNVLTLNECHKSMSMNGKQVQPQQETSVHSKTVSSRQTPIDQSHADLQERKKEKHLAASVATLH